MEKFMFTVVGKLEFANFDNIIIDNFWNLGLSGVTSTEKTKTLRLIKRLVVGVSQITKEPCHLLLLQASEVYGFCRNECVLDVLKRPTKKPKKSDCN